MDDHSLHPAFNGPSIDDEANDDFDFLVQKDDPDDSYWLSQEQVDEMNENRKAARRRISEGFRVGG
jgi:hypothetical protein